MYIFLTFIGTAVQVAKLLEKQASKGFGLGPDSFLCCNTYETVITGYMHAPHISKTMACLSLEFRKKIPVAGAGLV